MIKVTGERTYKLYIAVPVVSFLPLSANVFKIISEFPVPSKVFLYFSPLFGRLSALNLHCRNVAFLVCF